MQSFWTIRCIPPWITLHCQCHSLLSSSYTVYPELYTKVCTIIIDTLLSFELVHPLRCLALSEWIRDGSPSSFSHRESSVDIANSIIRERNCFFISSHANQSLKDLTYGPSARTRLLFRVSLSSSSEFFRFSFLFQPFTIFSLSSSSKYRFTTRHNQQVTPKLYEAIFTWCLRHRRICLITLCSSCAPWRKEHKLYAHSCPTCTAVLLRLCNTRSEWIVGIILYHFSHSSPTDQ